MSNQDVLVSQKFNNYNYAPGIATYGIDGKTGDSGMDGNNIYFTDFNIKDIDELKYFTNQIIQNYLPLKNSTVKINRTYKNSDLFFDKLGIIYRITDIDKLINDISSISSWEECFDIAGKLSIANDSSLFQMTENNRLILNSSLFGGYDIVVGVDPSTNLIDTNAVINIISNKVDENDNIEMVKIQSIDDIDIEDGKLSLYYKTTDNAFYLDSNKPIIINGDIKLNNDIVNTEYDNFSTVLTSDDTITYFKHICDQLQYNIIYDDTLNKYKLVIYQENSGSDLLKYIVNRNDTVFGKVYANENEQVLIKLSDLIETNTQVDTSNYWDNIATYKIDTEKINIEKHEFTFYAYQVGEYSQVMLNVPTYNIRCNSNNTENGGINLDISIYSTTIGNFGQTTYSFGEYFNSSLLTTNVNQLTAIDTMYIIDATEGLKNPKDVSLYNTYNFPNTSGIYKCTFNTNNFIDPNMVQDNKNKIIVFNIYSSHYNRDGESYTLFKNNYMEPIIRMTLDLNNVEGIDNTEKFTIYFTLDYSNEKFSINNIMLFDKDNLNKSAEQVITDRPCIQAYIPDNIESVQKFSLLHNTEIFINYQ